MQKQDLHAENNVGDCLTQTLPGRIDPVDRYLRNAAMPDLPEDSMCVDNEPIGFPSCVTLWETWF